LNPKLFAILIEPSPEPTLLPIHLPRLQLEPARLVRLRRHKEELKSLIWLLNLLLVRTHEPDTRHNTMVDLGVLQLEQQSILARNLVADLCDLVARPSDLDHVAPHRHVWEAGYYAIAVSAFFLLPCCSAREVGLVLAALRVCEVRAVVLVDCQAEAALEAADVVLKEVRVLVEVDRLEGELAEALAAVCVGCGLGGYTSATEFGAGAILGSC